MARTIDMSQVSSRGTRNKYQSILTKVQGEASVGDTLILRDGVFTITHVGAAYTNKQGLREVPLSLKPCDTGAMSAPPRCHDCGGLGHLECDYQPL